MGDLPRDGFNATLFQGIDHPYSLPQRFVLGLKPGKGIAHEKLISDHGWLAGSQRSVLVHEARESLFCRLHVDERPEECWRIDQGPVRHKSVRR
jgi:hypothetical protein